MLRGHLKQKYDMPKKVCEQ